MNILIPDQWLREFVDTQASVDDIARLLSLSGPSVERVQTLENEPVYDIEVTTNRVDMMSVVGIAREVATILPYNQIPAEFTSRPNVNLTYPHNPLDLTITDPQGLCVAYAGLSMELPSLPATPDWMAKRLLQTGQRPINLLVDVTNYLTWQLGFPVHIFDQDLLGKEITIRMSKAGETLTSLDGITRTLTGHEIVFANQQGEIIDLPAIMGTKNTAVTDVTRRVVIWSESLPAHLVRIASMGLGLRTQAAILNEKSVDPKGVKVVVEAVAELLTRLAGGQITSELLSKAPIDSPTTLSITASEVERYLGLTMSLETMADILNRLGFETKLEGDTCRATAPSFRQHDIETSVDLIEELARIYGYHNLDSRLPETIIPDTEPEAGIRFEYKIKLLLASWGWSEVYTYSLVSQPLANHSSHDLNSHLKLSNPLTDDLVYLRKSLLPSHQQLISADNNHCNHGIFELANTYHKSDNDLPLEELVLVLSIGSKHYAKLKQALDQLTHSLRIPIQLIATTHQAYLDNQVLEIRSGSNKLGYIGISKTGTSHLELLYQPLLQSMKPANYQITSGFSPVIEELTMTFPKHTLIGLVTLSLETLDSQIVSVSYLGSYQQNHSFKFEFLDTDRQLTTDDAKQLRERIVDHLTQHYQATLVGTVA